MRGIQGNDGLLLAGIVRLTRVPIVIFHRYIDPIGKFPLPLTRNAVIGTAGPPGIGTGVQTSDLLLEIVVLLPAFNVDQMRSSTHAKLLSPVPCLFLLDK